MKPPNFSAFHWSPHGCLITIGQHFVTTRVVHLPKRTETSLITESDQSRANIQLLQLGTARTAWSDSDQAVRAVPSCKSWLLFYSILFFSLQVTTLADFFQEDSIFVAYGQERRSNDDFNLNDNGKPPQQGRTQNTLIRGGHRMPMV